MASARGPPSKTTGKGGKKSSGGGSKGALKPTKDSKSRVSKKGRQGPPPKQQKTKSADGRLRKKKRVYTDAELGLLPLNMITPVGVQKPRGKKKGKVFVDDVESMVTILAIVNADKEGQIESKMAKARYMEEIREARKADADKREQIRKGQLEEKKDSLRRKRRRGDGEDKEVAKEDSNSKPEWSSKPRKRVSFG